MHLSFAGIPGCAPRSARGEQPLISERSCQRLPVKWNENCRSSRSLRNWTNLVDYWCINYDLATIELSICIIFDRNDDDDDDDDESKMHPLRKGLRGVNAGGMKEGVVDIRKFRGDVAGDREGRMQIAALPHVTAGENDRERPLYSARLGVGTRSVHKYRVQRRHQQFIAIISGVLTALCNGGSRGVVAMGEREREREREKERERTGFWNTTARLHERLICMTNYAVYPLLKLPVAAAPLPLYGNSPRAENGSRY
ncbi:Uncharacterized protein DBV15_08995 [Temnothorax longispinosus]|uniref:Uncharacterized protein n=1 Tax=Temnothorax longispinosus TaxID=300112 RepID=A0A4S2L320_9HYME|nr:Uncharacterized protein DBV15_08995 [Temnothorax longispinosus]